MQRRQGRAFRGWGDGGLAIGVAGQNCLVGTVDLHAALIDRRRSMAPALLAPLFGVPGVRFFSLQKGGMPARHSSR